MVASLGSAGRKISLVTVNCAWWGKAAADNMSVENHGCIPDKLFKQQVAESTGDGCPSLNTLKTIEWCTFSGGLVRYGTYSSINL